MIHRKLIKLTIILRLEKFVAIKLQKNRFVTTEPLDSPYCPLSNLVIRYKYNLSFSRFCIKVLKQKNKSELLNGKLAVAIILFNMVRFEVVAVIMVVCSIKVAYIFFFCKILHFQ